MYTNGVCRNGRICHCIVWQLALAWVVAAHISKRKRTVAVFCKSARCAREEFASFDDNCYYTSNGGYVLEEGEYILHLLAFATWALNQAGYIVNVFMGIDGNSFSFAYVLTFVLIIACATLSLVSLKNFNKAK